METPTEPLNEEMETQREPLQEMETRKEPRTEMEMLQALLRKANYDSVARGGY